MKPSLLPIGLPICAGALGLALGLFSSSKESAEKQDAPLRSTGISSQGLSPKRSASGPHLPRELSPEILQWIGETDTDTLFAAWLEHERLSHRDLSAVGNFVLRELISRDPEGICQRLVGEGRTRLLDRALSCWSESDPKSAALLALDAVWKVRDLHDWLVTTPIKRYAEIDPSAALALLDRAPIGSRFRHRVTDALLEQLFTSDQEACRDLLESEFLSNNSFPGSSVIATWAQVDISRTLEWVDQLKERNPKRHRDAVFSALTGLAQERPAWVAEQLVEREVINPGTTPWSLARLLSSWSQVDMEAASNWLQTSVPKNIRNRAASAAASRIMSSDIEFAVEQRLAGSEFLREHTEWTDLVANLSRKGYTEILAELPIRVSPEEQEDLNHALRIYGFRPSSPEDLADDLRSGRISNALEQWIHRNPEEVIQQALELDPEARSTVFHRWRKKLARTNPELLIESLRDLDDSSDIIADTTHWGFSELAQRDANRAKELVLTLPEGKHRDLSIDTIAINLLPLDPEGTIDWVASLIDEGQRSSDTKVLRRLIGQHSPGHNEIVAERLASP